MKQNVDERTRLIIKRIAINTTKQSSIFGPSATKLEKMLMFENFLNCL